MLFHLSVLVGKFQSLDLVLLAFLDVFRVVWHDLEPLWDFELFIWIDFNLLVLLVWVGHRSQLVQFHQFLGIVLFVFD